MGTFPILSRDPNLSAKPPLKPRENGSGFWKERWLKRMDKESSPPALPFSPELLRYGGAGMVHKGIDQGGLATPRASQHRDAEELLRRAKKAAELLLATGFVRSQKV